VSAISRINWLVSERAWMKIVPPRGLYFRAFDSKLSRINLSLARSARSSISCTFEIQMNALRQQGELVGFQGRFDEGRRRNSLSSSPVCRACHALKRQQVLDQLLQANAIVSQDGGHLALRTVQLPHGAIHQELRAFTDVGERCLELVRHVPQETIAFLGQLEQAHPQPFELPTQVHEVTRTTHRDGNGNTPLPS